jgi:tetratricopeptide (TPR) repeat protein
VGPAGKLLYRNPVGCVERVASRLPTTLRAVWTVLLGLAILALTPRAWAAAEDTRLIEVITQTMSEDYPGNLGEARKKILDALEKCKGGRCGNAAKSQAFVALGMVQSQLGDESSAKAAFAEALRDDPRAKLPATGTTPNIKNQWAEALAQAPPPPPAPVAPAPVDEPPATVPEPAGPAAPAGPPSTAGALPPGWKSREAFDLATAAVKALGAGQFDECVEKNRGSLEREDRPRTRLVLSRCEEKGGKYLDALKDAQKALELGIKTRDAELIRVARPRVEDLIKKMPHVTFAVPANVTIAEVKFDDRSVPLAALSKKFSIDPGKHHVSANGLAAGVPGAMEDDYDVKEGDLLTVRLTLQPQPGAITKGQLDCLLKAKNDEEIKQCVEKSGKSVVVKAAMETSGYADTNHVYVFSPELIASVVSPTGGWNIGATYVLDIVTAASPDIVSEASHRYKEKRNAGTLGGGYKLGTYGFTAGGDLSIEPDYVSRGVSASVTGDLKDKLITPRLGIHYGHDTIGRGGGATTPGSPTPFDHYSKTLDNTAFDGGVTWVLSPTMVLVTNAQLTLERGDQSKPYRYVPMFDPSIAGQVPVGATVDLVNRFRLPIRPLEQLPTERNRYALGGRVAKRFGNATLRVDQRFYIDSWGTKASTTDGRYMMDLSRHFRVWPHLRLHEQTGTDFYNRAYTAFVDPGTLAITLPTYRTGDRELSPLVTVTLGGGTRIALSSPEAAMQFAILVSGDFMYSRFTNSLFVTTRSAAYGTVGFEAEFE